MEIDFDENDFTFINTTPNAPNLDNGSLIPVYYDDIEEWTCKNNEGKSMFCGNNDKIRNKLKKLVII